MIKNLFRYWLPELVARLTGKTKPAPHQEPPMVLELRLIPPPTPPKNEPRMTNIWCPPDNGTCQFVGRSQLTGQMVRCPGPGDARIFKVIGEGEPMETIVACRRCIPLIIAGEDPEKLKCDILVDQ